MQHENVADYMICSFPAPNNTIFGIGAIDELAKEVKKLGCKKPLLVTDPGVINLGLIERIEDILKSEGLALEVYSKVEPEPPSRLVGECAALARQKSYDVIIGIGGGSSLDVAKGVSIMASNDGDVLDFAGADLVPRAGLPLILAPTTAGTGSEATRVFMVTDESDQSKKAIFSNFVLPSVALVDPYLTTSMPPVVTADTGIDALVHAIESYVSTRANPFSDMFAQEAIRLAAHNLYPAYAKAGNLEARINMSLAATLAGIAFTSSSVAAIHGLAYPLGTLFHMSHGRSMAVMLPYVVDYSRLGNLPKYHRIAELMGVSTEGLSQYESTEALVICLNQLLADLNVSTRLSDYGVAEKDIPDLVAGGMKQTRLFIPNPRDLTEKDIKGIYQRVLHGV